MAAVHLYWMSRQDCEYGPHAQDRFARGRARNRDAAQVNPRPNDGHPLPNRGEFEQIPDLAHCVIGLRPNC